MQLINRNSITVSLINGLYFITIFLLALIFASLGLARRLNTYDATKPAQELIIKKNQIDITNVVSAQVAEVLVEEGQAVREGDLIIRLEDPVTAAKIKSLEAVSRENISARTEAEVLKAQKVYYNIFAPEDGIVYKVDTAKGAYLGYPVKLVTIFSDSSVTLTGLFYPNEYSELLKAGNLDVYNSRLEQVFEVSFKGVSQVINIPGNSTQYELSFKFIEKSDAAAFLQGERVIVQSRSRDANGIRPEDLIKRFWNSFILGSAITPKN